MILHERVQPILDRFKGQSLERCLKLARNNFTYVDSDAGRAEYGDQWLEEHTVWETIFWFFYQVINEYGGSEIW